MDNHACENEGTVSREGVYTRLVSITGGCEMECIALVNPNDDLDGTFRAFDIDCNEWIKVYGWTCAIEDYQDGEDK